MVEASSSESEWQEERSIFSTGYLDDCKSTILAIWYVDFSNRVLSIVGYTVVDHDWCKSIIYKYENCVVSLLLYSMVEANCVWIRLDVTNGSGLPMKLMFPKLVL